MYFYIIIIISYLLGSIPFAKIIGLLQGKDIQKLGSGNIGFANSIRELGWGPALIVLTGDILKGFIPVVIALNHFSINQSLIVAGAAIFGHIFPIWLKFKGGKGVATAVGVTLALNIWIGLICILLWTIFLFTHKTGSVGSLVIAVALPILSIFFEPKLTPFFMTIFLMIIITHRTNIKNLWRGKETSIL